MGNDLISVIIPVYNVAQYVEECLDSVINQTYHNMEIIIIDDNSEEDYSAVKEKYSHCGNYQKEISYDSFR